MSNTAMDARWGDVLDFGFREETELNKPNVIARIQAELDELLNHFRVDNSEAED